MPVFVWETIETTKAPYVWVDPSLGFPSRLAASLPSTVLSSGAQIRNMFLPVTKTLVTSQHLAIALWLRLLARIPGSVYRIPIAIGVALVPSSGAQIRSVFLLITRTSVTSQHSAIALWLRLLA